MAAAGMDVIRVVSVMVLCLIASSHGYEFFVGGKDGWVEKPQESYDHWASRNRFQVHDTLVFKYKKEIESVLEVEKEHYVKCDTSNPIKTFSNGDSKVELTRSGAFYFISGKKSSCESGQKLHIVVMSEKRSTPPAPGPLAPTPSSPTAPPTVSPVSPTPISQSPSPSPKAQTPFSPSPQPQAWTPTPESPEVQPPSPQNSPSPSPTPVVSPPSPSNPPSPSPTPSNSPSPSSTASPPKPSAPPSPSPTASPPKPLTPPSPPSNATSPSPSPESDSPAPSPENSSAYAITSSTVLAFGISLFLSVTLGLF